MAELQEGAFGQTSEPPAVGEYRKIVLPGETPWAECVAIETDGTWQGRIANKLYTEYNDREREEVTGFGPQFEPLPRLHNFRQDDIVRFAWHSDTEPLRCCWRPAEQSPGRA